MVLSHFLTDLSESHTLFKKNVFWLILALIYYMKGLGQKTYFFGQKKSLP